MSKNHLKLRNVSLKFASLHPPPPVPTIWVRDVGGGQQSPTTV